MKRRAVYGLLLVGASAWAPARGQDCSCGAPCDFLLESDIGGTGTVTACNTITVIGANVLSAGAAELQVGDSVAFFDGFSVQAGGVLTVTIDSLLSCDPLTDADSDGVDECFDCDEADRDNWTSCASCVDLDFDSAWVGCDAYVIRMGPDCDDADSDRNPDSLETCNAIDDDCDLLIDECLLCAPPAAITAVACPSCASPSRGVASP